MLIHLSSVAALIPVLIGWFAPSKPLRSDDNLALSDAA